MYKIGYIIVLKSPNHIDIPSVYTTVLPDNVNI